MASEVAARLRASDLTLSSSELIAVMESVKQGRLSVDAAVDEVRREGADFESCRLHSSTARAPTHCHGLPASQVLSRHTSSRHEGQPTSSPPLAEASADEEGSAAATTTATTSAAAAAPAQPPLMAISPPMRRSAAPAERRVRSPPTQTQRRQRPHDGQLSNEDQVLIMNSVKAGSLSIEQAIRLAGGHQPATTTAAAAAAPGRQAAPLATSLPASASGQDFALLQALAAAGANVGWDVPERRQRPADGDAGEAALEDGDDHAAGDNAPRSGEGSGEGSGGEGSGDEVNDEAGTAAVAAPALGI